MRSHTVVGPSGVLVEGQGVVSARSREGAKAGTEGRSVLGWTIRNPKGARPQDERSVYIGSPLWVASANALAPKPTPM